MTLTAGTHRMIGYLLDNKPPRPVTMPDLLGCPQNAAEAIDQCFYQCESNYEQLMAARGRRLRVN